jgi:hypothetical protein
MLYALPPPPKKNKEKPMMSLFAKIDWAYEQLNGKMNAKGTTTGSSSSSSSSTASTPGPTSSMQEDFFFNIYILQ